MDAMLRAHCSSALIRITRSALIAIARSPYRPIALSPYRPIALSAFFLPSRLRFQNRIQHLPEDCQRLRAHQQPALDVERRRAGRARPLGALRVGADGLLGGWRLEA